MDCLAVKKWSLVISYNSICSLEAKVTDIRDNQVNIFRAPALKHKISIICSSVEVCFSYYSLSGTVVGICRP